MPPPCFYLGLDLGKRRDHTAAAVIRLHWVNGPFDPVYFVHPQIPHLEVCHIERFPKGTPYLATPPRVRKLVLDCDRLIPAGTSARKYLALDAAGPGSPVAELLRRANLGAELFPVQLTGGSTPSYSSGVTNIPRHELLTQVRLLLENEKLKFPGILRATDDLVGELRDCRYGGDGGKHDDMAVALALAAWLAVRHHNALVTTEPVRPAPQRRLL